MVEDAQSGSQERTLVEGLAEGIATSRGFGRVELDHVRLGWGDLG